MARQRIPLVASPIFRGELGNTTTYSTDQSFVNCFVETLKNPITGNGKAWCRKRLGFTASNIAGASYTALAGSKVWTGYSSGSRAVFSFLNGTTLGVYDIGGTIVGATIASISGATRIDETMISGNAYLTMVATKSTDSLPHAWFIKEGDASWTEITDLDYPANQTPAIKTVGNMVHMDGYAFIMDVNSNIWNSDLNSLANWTSTSFINAQVYPDTGVGLARSKNLIVAFGANSIEFFQNAGNATGSPLTRVGSATIRVGGVRDYGNGAETVKTIGESIYFIGVSQDSGAIGVYRLDGTTVTKISTPSIDKLLAYPINNNNSYGIAGAMRMDSMTHVVLSDYTTNGSANVGTPVYCIETNSWWFLKIASSSGVSTPQSCLGLFGQAYLTTATNGDLQGRKVFKYDQTNQGFQDDGNTLTMTVQTQTIDHGTDSLKECTAFRLIADTQTTSGNASISYSDNDYASFSTAKSIDMTQKQKKLDAGLGWFRSRAWKIAETVNRPFRAEAFEVEWEVSEE